MIRSDKVQAYLAKKWNLEAKVDSDGDGFSDAVEIANNTSFTNSSDSPSVSLSNAIASQIGVGSELASLEGNVAMWLDASNIDGQNNGTLTNGGAISEWTDLSGNGYNMTAHDTPVLNASGFGAGLPSVQFDGSNDYVQMQGILVPVQKRHYSLLPTNPSYGGGYEKIFMQGDRGDTGLLLSEGGAGWEFYVWGSIGNGTQAAVNASSYTSGIMIHEIKKDANKVHWMINGNAVGESNRYRCSWAYHSNHDWMGIRWRVLGWSCGRGDLY